MPTQTGSFMLPPGRLIRMCAIIVDRSSSMNGVGCSDESVEAAPAEIGRSSSRSPDTSQVDPDLTRPGSESDGRTRPCRRSGLSSPVRGDGLWITDAYSPGSARQLAGARSAVSRLVSRPAKARAHQRVDPPRYQRWSSGCCDAASHSGVPLRRESRTNSARPGP